MWPYVNLVDQTQELFQLIAGVCCEADHSFFHTSATLLYWFITAWNGETSNNLEVLWWAPYHTLVFLHVFVGNLRPWVWNVLRQFDNICYLEIEVIFFKCLQHVCLVVWWGQSMEDIGVTCYENDWSLSNTVAAPDPDWSISTNILCRNHNFRVPGG